MTIARTLLLSSALLLLTAAPAMAEVVATVAAPAGASSPRCRLIETVNFGINFGNVTLDAASARSYVNDRIAEVQTMAKEIGLDSLEVNNMNYNLYSNTNNYTYAGSAQPQIQLQLNGNVTFIMADANKAMELMEKVSQKGFNVTFSLNAHRQCN